MTTFRPNAAVKLIMRTEEFEDTTTLVARLPSPFVPDSTLVVLPAPPASLPTDDSAATRLALNQTRQQELEARRTSIPSEQYELERLSIIYERQSILESQTATEAASTPPESVSGAAIDDLTVLGQISPKSVQIQRNPPSTADTCTIVLSFVNAPIDPRILRSAAVEAIVGVVTPEDFEAGMERGETRSDGSLMSLISAPDSGPVPGATKFAGFVDTWSIDYDGASGDTITLECRDASAPLRDIALPTGASIDLSAPIDQGITAFLEAVSATTRGANVVWEAEGTPPIPGASGPQRRRPRRGQVQRRARRGNERMTLWDHITDVVRSLGIIPIVRDWDIVLIDPRTLYSSEGAATMVYGRNLDKLNFTRKIAGEKVPTVEVRCYDSERGRTLWARHPVATGQPASGVVGIDLPPMPSRANNVPPSGANPDEGIRVMSVSGITDTAALERIAQGIFEETGRQEIEGHFETHDAWSYYGNAENADLLDLRAGDPVELLIARGGSIEDEAVGSSTSLAALQAMDRASRSEYMIAIGWDPIVAARFAALQDATGFQTVFRTNESTVSFDSENGLKISNSFINYITVREG